ncbi:hypothetical protein JOD43_003474 [Pullulanibacillus pueri]|nr:hypothetical protein [Pullulanibacillus pueri]
MENIEIGEPLLGRLTVNSNLTYPHHFVTQKKT